MFLDAILQHLPLLLYTVFLLVSPLHPPNFHSYFLPQPTTNTPHQPPLYLLLLALYNLTLHPLARYPGPLLSRALPLPHALRIYTCRGPFAIHALHEKYGPVVRVGPNHLSYTDVRAWRDIFGHRAGEHIHVKENPKSFLFYKERMVEAAEGGYARSILDAEREEHGRLRRAVAGGFSERSMRAQEGVIAGFVDLLVGGLMKRARAGERVDLVEWYNWTTFDIIGDLVFAESFGCLEGERGHLFVDLVTKSIDQQAMFVALRYSGVGRLRVVKWVLNRVLQLLAADKLREMNEAMGAKLRHRLEVKGERTDLFDGLMSKREEWVSCPVRGCRSLHGTDGGCRTSTCPVCRQTPLSSPPPDPRRPPASCRASRSSCCRTRTPWRS